MDAFPAIVIFALRCGFTIFVFFEIIMLFWRHAFGGYYGEAYGQRWPIWTTPGKIPFRERPYTTFPPGEIANRFKYDDLEGKWEPKALWGWILTIVLLICVPAFWWITGHIERYLLALF